MKRLPRIALYCCLLLSAAVHADDDQIRYVRDWITIPLHQGQSADTAIVHSGVTSGTKLTLVTPDPGSGFTRVRTENGVEGWIASRYLISEPTAGIKLKAAEEELDDLRKTNARLEQEQANIPADQKLAAQQLVQLRADNARLQKDLKILQDAPSHATELAQENIQLKQNNAELQAQLQTTKKSLEESRRAQNYTLFREGALAVIAGALLTVLIPHLKPKKRSDWA